MEDIKLNFKIINDKNQHDTAKAFAYMKLSDLLYSQSFDTIKYFCDKSIAICDLGLKKGSKHVKRSFIYTI